MNSKFKKTMEINTPKHLKIQAPVSNSTATQLTAPEPAANDTTTCPTPKSWHQFDSPIYINHECPTTVCELLLVLANKYPQCLDYTYATQHIPSNPVVFTVLPQFYTNEQNAVGFFVPVNKADWDEGSGENDGYTEMLFTACSDADLESPGVREQLRSPISGMEGWGEAIRYQKGETEFRSAWRARVDDNVFMKGK